MPIPYILFFLLLLARLFFVVVDTVAVSKWQERELISKQTSDWICVLLAFSVVIFLWTFHLFYSIRSRRRRRHRYIVSFRVNFAFFYFPVSFRSHSFLRHTFLCLCSHCVWSRVNFLLIGVYFVFSSIWNHLSLEPRQYIALFVCVCVFVGFCVYKC